MSKRCKVSFGDAPPIAIAAQRKADSNESKKKFSLDYLLASLPESPPGPSTEFYTTTPQIGRTVSPPGPSTEFYTTTPQIGRTVSPPGPSTEFYTTTPQIGRTVSPPRDAPPIATAAQRKADSNGSKKKFSLDYLLANLPESPPGPSTEFYTTTPQIGRTVSPPRDAPPIATAAQRKADSNGSKSTFSLDYLLANLPESPPGPAPPIATAAQRKADSNGSKNAFSLDSLLANLPESPPGPAPPIATAAQRKADSNGSKSTFSLDYLLANLPESPPGPAPPIATAAQRKADSNGSKNAFSLDSLLANLPESPPGPSAELQVTPLVPASPETHPDSMDYDSFEEEWNRPMSEDEDSDGNCENPDIEIDDFEEEYNRPMSDDEMEITKENDYGGDTDPMIEDEEYQHADGDEELADAEDNGEEDYEDEDMELDEFPGKPMYERMDEDIEENLPASQQGPDSDDSDLSDISYEFSESDEEDRTRGSGEEDGDDMEEDQEDMQEDEEEEEEKKSSDEEPSSKNKEELKPVSQPTPNFRAITDLFAQEQIDAMDARRAERWRKVYVSPPSSSSEDSDADGEPDPPQTSLQLPQFPPLKGSPTNETKDKLKPVPPTANMGSISFGSLIDIKAANEGKTTPPEIKVAESSPPSPVSSCLVSAEQGEGMEALSEEVSSTESESMLDHPAPPEPETEPSQFLPEEAQPSLQLILSNAFESPQAIVSNAVEPPDLDEAENKTLTESEAEIVALEEPDTNAEDDIEREPETPPRNVVPRAFPESPETPPRNAVPGAFPESPETESPETESPETESPDISPSEDPPVSAPPPPKIPTKPRWHDGEAFYITDWDRLNGEETHSPIQPKARPQARYTTHWDRLNGGETHSLIQPKARPQARKSADNPGNAASDAIPDSGLVPYTLPVELTERCSGTPDRLALEAKRKRAEDFTVLIHKLTSKRKRKPKPKPNWHMLRMAEDNHNEEEYHTADEGEDEEGYETADEGTEDVPEAPEISIVVATVEKYKLSKTHCNPRNILLAMSAFVLAATIGWFSWNGHQATSEPELPESVMAMCQPVSLYGMCEHNSWCGIGPRVPSIPAPTAFEIARLERKKFLETNSLPFQDVFGGVSCGLAFEETSEATSHIYQGSTPDDATPDDATTNQEFLGDFAEVACAVLLEGQPDSFIVPVCEVVVQITWSISEFFLGRWLQE